MRASYAEIDGVLPRPSEGNSGAFLIVGNGAFESAAQILPPDTAIVICDINPGNLLLQRTILDTVQKAETRDEFLRGLDEVTRTLADTYQERYDIEGPEGLPIRNMAYRVSSHDEPSEYGKVEETWGTDDPPFFLSSDDAYVRARTRLLSHTIAFRQIDLREEDQVDRFGQELRDAHVGVIGANFTNVFEEGHAGHAKGRAFMDAIPVAPDAPIISSAIYDQAPVSEVMTMLEWREHLSFG